MNHFTSWTTTGTAPTEEAQLLKRSIEIRVLVEDTHPNTLEKIVVQLCQRKIQDNLQHVVVTHLTIGSTVYTKSHKIQGKLQPKF